MSKKSKQTEYAEVIYYWYYHLDEEAVKEIEPALNAKDFKAFMRCYNKYNTDFLDYLPDTASAYDEHGEFIEEVDVTTKEGFDLITHHEYECG